MKMQFLRSLLLSASVAVMAFTFTSCRDDDDNTATPAAPAFPTCRIVSGNIDGEAFTVTYNSNKRITAVSGLDGENFTLTHAGDSIVTLAQIEGSQVREVTKVANNLTTSARFSFDLEFEDSTIGAFNVRVTRTSNFEYNADNTLARVRTVQLAQALTSTGIPVGPPQQTNETTTFSYTNQNLTSIVSVTPEGTTNYTFAPSTTKASDNNLALLTVYEGVFLNFGLIGAPTLNLGKHMPASTTIRFTGGSETLTYAYTLDNRQKITKVDVSGANNEVFNFAYNCD